MPKAKQPAILEDDEAWLDQKAQELQANKEVSRRAGGLAPRNVVSDYRSRRD